LGDDNEGNKIIALYKYMETFFLRVQGNL